MFQSDVAMLALWRAGCLSNEELSPEERRRLWYMVLMEALADIKAKQRQQALDEVVTEMKAETKKKTA